MRDCMAYLLSVIALILIIYDAVVEWYVFGGGESGEWSHAHAWG